MYPFGLAVVDRSLVEIGCVLVMVSRTIFFLPNLIASAPLASVLVLVSIRFIITCFACSGVCDCIPHFLSDLFIIIMPALW